MPQSCAAVGAQPRSANQSDLEIAAVSLVQDALYPSKTIGKHSVHIGDAVQDV